MKTQEASGFAEKNEIESLFLDCVDQCKKDHFKIENATAGLPKQPR